MLNSQRHLFSIPEDITYFNCAYLSPQLNAVTAAGQKSVLLKQHPWEIAPADFFPQVERLRQLFAALIDAAPEDIALVSATSYGIASAARNLPIQSGQAIVLLQDEFPSNVYAWYELAKQKGAVIKTIARPHNEDWTQQILNNLQPNVAIAALPHCHWTDGGLIDLKLVSEVCRQRGIALVIDATQSLGAMPFSVKEIAADFVVASGYKWLLGPYGLGLMYVAPQHQQGSPLEYSWITRKNSEDFSRLTQYQTEYTPGAGRFDMGERSQFIHVPMLIAALEQILAWGVDNIYTSLQHYNEELANSVKTLGINCIDSQYRAGHMLGLKIPGTMDMGALANTLRQKKIYISIRGQAMRVSPHLYNGSADQQRFLQALSDSVILG